MTKRTISLKRKYITRECDDGSDSNDDTYYTDISSQDNNELDDELDDDVTIPLNKKPRKQKKIDKTIKFDRPITTLDELIHLGESFSHKYNYTCNLNLEKLSKIVPELIEIKNLIGLATFKRTLVKQIVFILLDIQTSENSDMRHIVLNGGPGTGKTTVARILGKIYSKLGLLSKDTFTIGKRTDFIAEYLGQTEHKTLKFLEKCKGGVLFIDEAYSLGCGTDQDSYSKIVIDTLNQFLSENSNDFICIIAGYKEDLEKCVFNINKGMDRRFTYRYTIESYTPNELLEIFKKDVNDGGWLLDTDAINVEIFQNKDLFKYYGGDIRTLFEKCKECHSERAITLPKNRWKILSKLDVRNGLNAYKSDRQLNNISNNYLMYI